MIHLTRLNGHPIIVNCDLIKFVEATPDTTLSLCNGEKLIVLESPEEIVQRVSAFRSGVLALAWPEAPTVLAATSPCAPAHPHPASATH